MRRSPIGKFLCPGDDDTCPNERAACPAHRDRNAAATEWLAESDQRTAEYRARQTALAAAGEPHDPWAVAEARAFGPRPVEVEGERYGTGYVRRPKVARWR